MNILFTSVGDFLTLESDGFLQACQIRYQNVERMSFERVSSYLHFDLRSALALVDAIVCMADTDMVAYSSDRHFPALDFPLEKALALAKRVRDLPEECAMRDGRKWRSIPFVIFSSDSRKMRSLKKDRTHAHIYPATDPFVALDIIQGLVDEYHNRVLDGYRTVGFLVCFEKGRARIRPALTPKNIHGENEHYFSPKDRRRNKRWVRVKRNTEGLRHDVELFRVLVDNKNTTESQMHRFFEDHPAILAEARMGIPISHAPRFSSPEGQTPDFSISPTA